MSETLDLVRACGEFRVSRHGGAELRADGVDPTVLIDSTARAKSVEDYPSAFKGPSVLALHTLSDGTPVHVVGISGWDNDVCRSGDGSLV